MQTSASKRFSTSVCGFRYCAVGRMRLEAQRKLDLPLYSTVLWAKLTQIYACPPQCMRRGTPVHASGEIGVALVAKFSAVSVGLLPPVEDSPEPTYFSNCCITSAGAPCSWARSSSTIRRSNSANRSTPRRPGQGIHAPKGRLFTQEATLPTRQQRRFGCAQQRVNPTVPAATLPRFTDS